MRAKKGQMNSFKQSRVLVGATFETLAILAGLALSIPADRNPFIGRGNCADQQSGPVWFMMAPITGEIHCTVPAGKALFFPVIGTESDSPCPDSGFAPAPGQSLDDFISEASRAISDQVSHVSVDIDGISLGDLSQQRITSPLFYVTGDVS